MNKVTTVDALTSLSLGAVIEAHFENLLKYHHGEQINYADFQKYLQSYFTVKSPPIDIKYSALIEVAEHLATFSVWCVFNTKGVSVGQKQGNETSTFHRQLFELAQEIEGWVDIYNENV